MSDTRRILIIDDQEHIHQDYRKVLEQSASTTELDLVAAELFGDAPANSAPGPAFELNTAFQGKEGLEQVIGALAEGRPYALAFVDIRMPPGWDGVETVQRIWEVDPEILIVLCSAYSDYSWEQMSTELGRTDRFLVLRKPFENTEVRQCAMAMTERWLLARKDPLTGLLNRRALSEHLRRAGAGTTADTPLACLMLDIDHFKRTNDLFGHQAGDEVLRQLGDRLPGWLRPSDVIGRFGGEELVVLLPNTCEAKAAELADRIRLQIGSTSLGIGESLRSISVSIGVAAGHQGMVSDASGEWTEEALVERADQALRVAKQTGRNRVVAFSTMKRVSAESQVLELDRIWQDVPAERVMSEPIACMDERDSVEAAVQCFLRWRLESAPVVDAEGALVGMISESQVLELILSPDGWNRTIGSVMERNVVCYEEQTPVKDILDFLMRSNTTRVVITRGNRPLGGISRSSLLRWFGHAVALQCRDSHDCDATAPSDTNRRVRVDGTVRALVKRASTLVEQLEKYSDDPVPPIVDNASKLQELINDLLADAAPPLSSERAVFIESSCDG